MRNNTLIRIKLVDLTVYVTNYTQLFSCEFFSFCYRPFPQCSGFIVCLHFWKGKVMRRRVISEVIHQIKPLHCTPPYVSKIPTLPTVKSGQGLLLHIGIVVFIAAHNILLFLFIFLAVFYSCTVVWKSFYII